MKRRLVLLICLAALLFGAAAESSQSYQYERYTYVLQEDGSAKIVKFDHEDYRSLKLKIPEKLDGHPVTAIGDSALYLAHSLESDQFPDSVTSIGDWAFFMCDQLTEVELPDSLTEIGANAFLTASDLVVTVHPGSAAEQYCREMELNYRYEDAAQ